MPDAPLPAEIVGDPPLTAEQLDVVVDAIMDAEAEGDIDRGVEVIATSRFGPDTDDDSKPPWRIRSDREAEWAMRIYALAAAELADAEANAAAWRADITRWLAGQRRRPDATLAFMGFHLRSYQAARREADPKAATLTLPSGVVKSRKVGERVDIDDPASVVLWAQSQGRDDLLKSEPRLTEVRETVEVQTVSSPGGAVLECGHTVKPRPASTPTVNWSPWEVGFEAWCQTCQAISRVQAVLTSDERVAVDVKSGMFVPGTTVVPEHVEVSEPKPNGGALR